MTDDMHGYMTELGSSDSPEPDPRFVTNLELQLRESRAGATVYRFARPRRWPATVAAVTFSVAVVAFGLATVDTSPQVVSISAASGAEVRMPDGQVVEATPGLELPNGAVVEVGPAGSARIGDIDVGPLQAAEITAEGIIVASDEVGGPIRLPTTAVASQVSVVAPRESARSTPVSAPSDGTGGTTGALGSSGDGEGQSSTSEPSTSTSDPVSAASAPDTSAVDVETTAPPASTSSLPISATSIVRNDSTSTTGPTSTSSSVQTTSTPPPPTTAASSTTSTSTSAPTSTSTSTSEPTTGSTTTTTEHQDQTTTSTSSSTTTQPASTSTSTTVEPTPTSTTATVDPVFLKVIGELRFERASCQVDTKTLVSLVYAIATDSVSPEQSTVLKNCLG